MLDEKTRKLLTKIEGLAVKHSERDAAFVNAVADILGAKVSEVRSGIAVELLQYWQKSLATIKPSSRFKWIEAIVISITVVEGTRYKDLGWKDHFPDISPIEIINCIYLAGKLDQAADSYGIAIDEYNKCVMDNFPNPTNPQPTGNPCGALRDLVMRFLDEAIDAARELERAGCLS